VEDVEGGGEKLITVDVGEIEKELEVRRHILDEAVVVDLRLP